MGIKNMLYSIIFIDSKGLKRSEVVSNDLLIAWLNNGLIREILFAIEA